MAQLRLRTILLSTVLTLLIFSVQGGYGDANMSGRPFVNMKALTTEQVLDTPYSGVDNADTLRRLHHLGGLRHFNSSTKKSRPSTLNDLLPQVTRGVTLAIEVLQTAAGPEQVSMLNVDLTNSNIRLGVVQAYSRLINPAQPLSAMADQAGAVAGINGDFYEIHGTNVPIGEE